MRLPHIEYGYQVVGSIPQALLHKTISYHLQIGGERFEHPPPLQEYTPVNWRVSATFLIKEDNPSTQRRKRYWDKGSPCLMPQVGVMKHVGSPLISIKYEAVHTISIAKFTHCVGSPILSIIYRRNSHSTLS